MSEIEYGTGDGARASDTESVEGSKSPAIVVEGLRKEFSSGEETVTAVDDVSFTVGQNSIVGVLGPNGAGKTTMLKSMVGLIEADDGTVRINGADIAEEPKKVHRDVDVMLEGARNNYWRMTVEENMQFFTRVGGEDPSVIADRHNKLITELDIEDKRDEEVRNLSRGMKQKASIASALARDVSVVLLDEPTLGLDIESSVTLRTQLKRIVREREMTVLISSHDMDTIQEVCDRVIILTDGEIVVDDQVGNLLDMFETQEYQFTVRNLSESDISALEAEFPVTGVTSHDGNRRLNVALDPERFYSFVEACKRVEGEVHAVETISPDLEEIFMNVIDDDE